MVTLRADEHRYLVTASGRDEVLVRRIPGAKFVASTGAMQLPRQPGVVIALDRAFGDDGWDHPADLALEVAETRGRQVGAAHDTATVTLSGNELAIECTFGDKELVKLVPGYRWSAPQRRWFVPASPMALEFLGEYFGDKLSVEEAAAKLIELRRVDEAAALDRAASTPSVTTPEPSPSAPPTSEDSNIRPPIQTSVTDAALSPLMERLILAIGSLETSIARLVERLPTESVPVQFTAAPTTAAHSEPVTAQAGRDSSVREELAGVDADPTGALNRISSQLQLASDAALPEWRALAGIASSLLGQHQMALTYLRKAEEQSAVPLEPELHRRIRDAYLESVLALITAACRPERPVASLPGLEELLLAELVQHAGFNDAALGGPEARDLLSFLMDDPQLRRHNPVLADYCRVLHLLCVARSGRWMAAERVIEMLRHRELTDDGFALGLIVLANTVFEQPCMEEWMMSWPPESSDVGFDELRWITAGAIERLRNVDPTLGAEGALANLSLISAASVEVASMNERRELVKLIPPKAAHRRYAEFLAGYKMAEAGQRKVTQNFPGYLQVLASWPLSSSAGHLLTVFVNDSGGADSTIRHIADEVFLDAVNTRGVRDPRTEVLDLVDMLAESPRADNLLNRLSAGVEEDAFPGAGSFSHEQRTELFDRTFRTAVKAGHDLDTVMAFDRCAREMLKHGETEALRTLCMSVPPGFKPLQLPVGQALLSIQLESGENFVATAEAVLRNCNPKDPKDEGTHELKGLAIAFPAFRDYLAEKIDEPELAEPDGRLRGKRLVVVGGHAWLRKHAMPQFESWGVKATWLDPDSAKQGSQALDLAGGQADLVVINTACISHAASGRVLDEAKKTNQRYAYHNSRGVGALLSIAKESLADTEPPLIESTPKPSRAAERRRLVR